MINLNTTAASMETQDLTIEQLVGDITGSMIKSMNSVLEPLVLKINKNTKRDTVIHDWLKQLPEYQHLLLENKRLEEENLSYKNVGHVTMHIKEKNPIVTDVKTIKTTLADYTLEAGQLACMRSRLDEWRNRFNAFVDNLCADDIHNEVLMTLKQDYDGICYELLVEPARSKITKTGDICNVYTTSRVSEEVLASEEEEEVLASEEEEEVVASEEEEVLASEEEEEVVASEEEEEVVASEEEEEVLASEEEEVLASEEEEVLASEEEEEEELFVVEMEDDDGNMIEYLTNDDQNGSIFILEDGDGVGKKVGKFVNGEPELFAD